MPELLIIRSPTTRTYTFSASYQLPPQPELPQFCLPERSTTSFEQTLTDPAGDAKISPTGVLADGRCLRCHSFQLPLRVAQSPDLFVLALDLAPVLNYRDAHHLFKKNRQLVKVSTEPRDNKFLLKEHLILPKVVGKRLLVVTVRLVYVVFGARVIVGGLRVKDDYWEAEFIKQGFTELLPVEPGNTGEVVGGAMIDMVSGGESDDDAAANGQPEQQPIRLARNAPAHATRFVLMTDDEREQYLAAPQHTLVYPGQGFINLFDGSIGVPDYARGGLPMQLLENSQARHPLGLPLYKPLLQHHVRMMDSGALSEVEHLHSTVLFNTYLGQNRRLRRENYQRYYLQKVGTPEVKTDEHSEERIPGERIITVVKRVRKPNTNAVGRDNLLRVAMIYGRP